MQILNKFLCLALLISNLGHASDVLDCLNQGHYIGKRLEGEWILDSTQNEKLWPGETDKYTWTNVNFSSDSSVITKFKNNLDNEVGDLCAYSAGSINFTVNNENIETVYSLVNYLGRGTVLIMNPYNPNDAQGFLVTLVKAKDSNSDRLYIGGERNDEPMMAYIKKPGA